MNSFSAHRLILFADAGIPMIFITMPAMVMALIPIVAIEALLIQRRVHYKNWPVIRATALANIVSTVLGVPLTWGALFLCEIAAGFLVTWLPTPHMNWNSPIAQVISVFISAPWIAPSDETGTWAVPLAALVLLVPFFFVSVWSERLVMEHMLPVTSSDVSQPGELSESRLRIAVRDANLLSYGGLFLLTCFWMIWELFHRSHN